MATPEPADFPRFFRAVYERPPFPWQTRLAARVAGGSWPDVLALPTGSGKTSVIDIAVFALACAAARGDANALPPRRIFFVVDRRLVVDAAFQHARRLAQSLEQSDDQVVREVARQLRLLAGTHDPVPLSCFELRGGLYRDEAWARNPLQPAVIASTVDQVGSRLLFRGYGLSDRMRPVHAGLIGTDSLIVLDEAHCSNPFRQTLAAARRYMSWGERVPPNGLQVVAMSATPPDDPDADVFPLDEEDYRDPTLSARIDASKPARLVCAAGAKGSRADDLIAQRIARQAEEAARAAPLRAIGVVVNRVKTARIVAGELRRRVDADVELLIGRMRSVDRDWISRRIERRVAVGQRSENLPRTLIVVATQCVEVGADFDFDRLITECASLDALRQRFGRLNRTGRPIEAEAAIVVREDQSAPSDDPEDADPIYGDALAHTWSWLSALAGSDGTIDLGIAAVARHLAGSSPEDIDVSHLSVHRPDAPVLLPAHLDCWVQTNPAPHADPDPALFLHGRAAADRSVYICWRADLDPARHDREAWLELLSVAPPALAECLPVPVSEVRRWLADRTPAGGADVEGAAEPGEDGEERQQPLDVLVFRWRGGTSAETRFVSARDIRPDDVLVLSAAAGGWNELGHVPPPWDTAERIDRGDRANLMARARPVLRLHSSLINAWPEVGSRGALLELVAEAGREDAPPEETLTRFQLLLADLGRELEVIAPEDGEDDWKWLRDSLSVLCRPRHVRTPIPHPFGRGLILVARHVHPYLAAGVPADAIVDEDDRTAAARAIPLERHSEQVRAEVARLVDRLRLEDRIAGLELAASVHDLGKADERFQALIRNGTVLEAIASGELLAKSECFATTWRERNAARRRAGYPVGGRHELASVRLLERMPALSAEFDRDLVLHLVASHHGYCRPFAPIVDDPDPVEVSVAALGGGVAACSSATGLERLDSGVPERFWGLVRRYGWWGLAYLEAIFRLADHAASASAEAAAAAGAEATACID